MEQIRYLKTDGDCSKLITYEFDNRGTERFMVAGARETECLLFVPSEHEKDLARRIRLEANKPDGWLRLHHEHGNLIIDWAR